MVCCAHDGWGRFGLHSMANTATRWEWWTFGGIQVWFSWIWRKCKEDASAQGTSKTKKHIQRNRQNELFQELGRGYQYNRSGACTRREVFWSPATHQLDWSKFSSCSSNWRWFVLYTLCLSCDVKIFCFHFSCIPCFNNAYLFVYWIVCLNLVNPWISCSVFTKVETCILTCNLALPEVPKI